MTGWPATVLAATFGVNRPTPVTARLSHAAYDPNTNAYGPTDTQRDSLALAQRVFGEISAELSRLIDREYQGLLDAWTLRACHGHQGVEC